MAEKAEVGLTLAQHLRKLADEVEGGRRVTAAAVITTNESDEMVIHKYGVNPGDGQRLLIDFVIAFHEAHAKPEQPSIYVPGPRTEQ